MPSYGSRVRDINHGLFEPEGTCNHNKILEKMLNESETLWKSVSFRSTNRSVTEGDEKLSIKQRHFKVVVE